MDQMNPINPKINVGYNKNDFFYLTNANDMSPAGCSYINKAAQIKCGDAFNPTNTDDVRVCYQNELCINQDNVGKMYDIQQKHLQYQAQLMDLQTKYQNQMMTTFNLGIGIVGAIVYIYYNK